MAPQVSPAPQSIMNQFNSKASTAAFSYEVEGCGRHFSVVFNLRRHCKVHKDKAPSEGGSKGQFSWYGEIDSFAEYVSTASRRAGQHEIGSCNAKLIGHYQMREPFWLEMDNPHAEIHSLAFDRFGRYGRPT